MKLLFNLILLTCVSWASSAWGQTNFRESLLKADPVPAESTFSPDEKVKAHREFLDRAIRENSLEKRIYGCCYLFKDCILIQDYPEATRYLLLADSVAKASGNSGWQGAVCYRKGILSVYLKDYKKAIPQYEEAVRLCGSANDSLCVAESLEQLSSMYGRTGNYAEANRFFNLAMPLLERFGGDMQSCVALNNFGNLLSLQNRPLEAIPCFERALVITEKLGDQQRTAQFLNNLADPYMQLRRFDKALDIYQRCIQLNRENDWPDNLVFNYAGISEVYKQTGDFQSALAFFQQFHDLRDSLMGATTKDKIADLEVKYASQQKELELQKSRVALGMAQRDLELRTVFIVFVLFLAGLGLARWRVQNHRAKHERIQNQDNLNNLTRILLEKNTQLAILEEQISGQSASDGSSSLTVDFENDLYNQRILTDADWAAFKAYFEKAYPGYLLRLRNAWSTLSDAEERLFLFIKLNLNRKEAAAMLGISADSVKKTRNRLRKRLGLDEEHDLDGFIRVF